MSLKAYLFLMILATLLCLSGLVAILVAINPWQTNWPGFVLFYTMLFLTCLGLGAIIGFIFRFLILRKTLAHHAVVVSFRQAFLFSLLVIGVLWLQSQALFSWLNVALLVVGFSTAEFFLLSFSVSHND